MAAAYFGLTRTTTSPKITLRSPSLPTFTETICLSTTPASAASSTLKWMWRFAAMTPFSMTTSPAGPFSVHPGVPSRSPDSRIGAVMPSLRASVSATSTCVSGRVGPRMDMTSEPFGPMTSTFSFVANWPGWERSFLLESTAFSPKSALRSASVTWRWRAEVSTMIFILCT